MDEFGIPNPTQRIVGRCRRRVTYAHISRRARAESTGRYHGLRHRRRVRRSGFVNMRGTGCVGPEPLHLSASLRRARDLRAYSFAASRCRGIQDVARQFQLPFGVSELDEYRLFRRVSARVSPRKNDPRGIATVVILAYLTC